MQGRFLLFLKITKIFHTFTTMKISNVSYNYNFISNHLGTGTLITDINGQIGLSQTMFLEQLYKF